LNITREQHLSNLKGLGKHDAGATMPHGFKQSYLSTGGAFIHDDAWGTPRPPSLLRPI
jgi:hypothetical protein